MVMPRYVEGLCCFVVVRADVGVFQLWCWIGAKWNALRIYTYYMPIWICILLSTIIYVAVGYHVFHQRNQLRNLTFSNHGKGGKEPPSSDERESAEKVGFHPSGPLVLH
jgi:hypothetical protein